MLGQFGDNLDGNIVGDTDGDVVEQDGQRRAIGYAAKIIEHSSRGHSACVVGGGTDQDRIVVEPGRSLSQFESSPYALLANAGDEHFFGRGGFSGYAQNIAGLGVVEHDRFARGP